MSVMDHDRAEELFSEHYDRTLAPELRQALDEHLGSCPTCRALREVFGEVVDALHRVRDHPFAAPAGLASRAAAAALAAPRAPQPVRAVRQRARELPLPLLLAAGVLAVFVTLGVLGALGSFGSEGRLGRLRARTVTAGAYLAERKDRLVEDWRLLRIVVGSAFEGRLDRVQERIEEYRRLREKRRQAEPSPAPSTPAPGSGQGTNSNSSESALVPLDERQERRPQASGRQGARS
jgi:anti-sigma factor RsiW